jgi:hypothetical protein
MNRLFESARGAAGFYKREGWACGSLAVVSAGCRSIRAGRQLAMAAVLGLSLVAGGSALAQQTPAASPAAAHTAAPASPAAPDNAAAPPASAAAPTTAGPSADAGASASGAAAASGAGDATPPAGADTAAPEAAPDTRGLDQEVQGLKKDVVDLNRDLFVLEEELLFPANTQVAVFLSMDVGDFFALDSVQLKIDQKEVINYLYTPREVEALLRGGVHRLYLGNLKVGKHELVAFFSGKGPNDRDYKRGASLSFEKGIGAKYLELKINDRQRKQQPEFEIKDWE